MDDVVASREHDDRLLLDTIRHTPLSMLATDNLDLVEDVARLVLRPDIDFVRVDVAKFNSSV